MDEIENKTIIDLLKAIDKGIKKHGIRKIVKTLRQIDTQTNNENYAEIIDFIVTIVCESIDVEKPQLYGFDARGNVTIARKLCILLFRKHLKFNDYDTAAHFNRNRQVTHITEIEFKNIDINNKFEKEYFKMYTYLDSETEKFKQNLESKSNEQDDFLDEEEQD